MIVQRGHGPGYPKVPKKRGKDHIDPTPLKKHKSLEDPLMNS